MVLPRLRALGRLEALDVQLRTRGTLASPPLGRRREAGLGGHDARPLESETGVVCVSPDDEDRSNDRLVLDQHECIPETDPTTGVDRCQLCGGVIDE